MRLKPESVAIRVYELSNAVEIIRDDQLNAIRDRLVSKGRFVEFRRAGKRDDLYIMVSTSPIEN